MKIIALLMFVSLSLLGCDNSPKPKPSLIQQTADRYAQATTLQGVVSDDQQAIHSGVVKVTGNNGQLLTQIQLDSNHYQVEIAAQTELPIVLSFYSQDSSKKPLISVVAHSSMTHYDINPLTTKIAQMAMAMGGYTKANLRRAAEDSVHVPDANKTSTGFRGDPTTQYGGWH
jgi:hypothetical protein